jgi:hypothetical protein
MACYLLKLPIGFANFKLLSAEPLFHGSFLILVASYSISWSTLLVNNNLHDQLFNSK